MRHALTYQNVYFMQSFVKRDLKDSRAGLKHILRKFAVNQNIETMRRISGCEECTSKSRSVMLISCIARSFEVGSRKRMCTVYSTQRGTKKKGGGNATKPSPSLIGHLFFRKVV